jgi:hypothetical protein
MADQLPSDQKLTDGALDALIENIHGYVDAGSLLHWQVTTCLRELKQMRADWAAIDKAAEELSESERYPHWTCKTHGDFDARVAVGCPECVRHMRSELQELMARGDR